MFRNDFILYSLSVKGISSFPGLIALVGYFFNAVLPKMHVKIVNEI
jgi:hypothetical protein